MRGGLGLAAVVFAALVALVGCGGSSSNSSSTDTASVRSGEALSKAEFVEQADAICTNRKSEREALQSEAEELAQEINAGSDAAREELADLLAKAADNAEEEFSELRGLTPPPADAATIDEMLSSAGRQVALTRAGVAALRKGDFEAFTEVTRSGRAAKAKAAATARSYGLEVCGAEGE
jgi:CHASE3 domain sensor protein